MRFVSILLLLLFAACGGSDRAAAQRFAQSGVIEGFYGPPWSHQGRLDMLRFMGRVGLTHYYYAPKDDPYHRARWSEPYPDAAFRRLGELATVARSSGVVFVYAISPGGSIVYADSGDYARLLAKIDRVAGLGVTAFALFLDDVPPTLQHPADRAAFADLAAAQASLIGRLHTVLAARGASLAVTPTTYTDAWGDRGYLARLGAVVPPDVPFFWTGIDVASPEITTEQAVEWGQIIGRPPLVWDNYPVNDFARWRLFLGPVRHRSADLYRHTVGIIANPMNEAHASMLALATLASYAAAPDVYDPASALSDAVALLYGPDAETLLTPFFAAYGDYPEDDNVFEPLFIPTAGFRLSPIEDRLAQLGRAVTTLDSAAGQVGALRSLVDEIAPFVTRTTDRLAELERAPDWERRGDSLLYRRSLDRVVAAASPAPITVDGRFDDWPEGTWTELHGPDGRRRPRTRFATDRGWLYVAVDLPDPAPSALSGLRIGERDHVALVVQHDEDAGRRALDREDLVVLVGPPSAAGGSSTFVGTAPFTGFMAKYLADNRDLTWSEFLLSMFGEGEARADRADVRCAATADRGRYRVEIGIPVEYRAGVRLSLSVLDVTGGERTVFALARRNYPANPATFAEIVLGK
ncbi:MAG: beta-N-acetylglucosaminidase domain-containing protein [Gemmatimonadales bacterium]|nr:beta-N-acetylglucosaminidase domain-containing protein [Gemmatimonadales bacterium]